MLLKSIRINLFRVESGSIVACPGGAKTKRKRRGGISKFKLKIVCRNLNISNWIRRSRSRRKATIGTGGNVRKQPSSVRVCRSPSTRWCGPRRPTRNRNRRNDLASISPDLL